MIQVPARYISISRLCYDNKTDIFAVTTTSDIVVGPGIFGKSAQGSR